ncbi:MAG: hypothetical protein Q9209_005447 [Squamulea sp. 1 TL-2023]
MNISFHPLLSATIPDRRKFSVELLTWIIPSSLDPTYHQRPAAQFEDLGEFIKYTESMTTSRRPGALVTSFRGWVSGPQEDKEPSVKTHLFFFVWEDAEAERRVKDGSPGESEYESWAKNFVALQREWEAKGMKCESLHLRMEDFKEQLRWRAMEAKRKAKGK